MSVIKIIVVFTILTATIIQNVSCSSFQTKDSKETEIEDDKAENESEESFEDNYGYEGSDLEEYNQHTNRNYNYRIDLLYFGQEQLGQFNSKGEPDVTGEYYFVENGKEYRVSYVADERGYRPIYTVMDTTKDSPPTYQGRKETGEYTFTKYSKQYKVKYIVDEGGFHPTDVEVKPVLRPPPPPPPPTRPPVPYDPLIVASFLGGG